MSQPALGSLHLVNCPRQTWEGPCGAKDQHPRFIDGESPRHVGDKTRTDAPDPEAKSLVWGVSPPGSCPAGCPTNGCGPRSVPRGLGTYALWELCVGLTGVHQGTCCHGPPRPWAGIADGFRRCLGASGSRCQSSGLALAAKTNFLTGKMRTGWRSCGEMASCWAGSSEQT